MPIIEGTEGSDTLIGSSERDVIDGYGGNDTIDGLAGNDELAGGDGDDWLQGGDGHDLIQGGAGIDTASYASAPSGVTVNVSSRISRDQNTVGAGWDWLSGIENLVGSDHSDTLIGDDYIANRLFGGAGNDTLVGDYQDYGFSADYLDGGIGADSMRGGKGTDTYIVDNLLDSIHEAPGIEGGVDTLLALASYDLAAGVAVEIMNVFDPDGTDALDLSGNEFRQSITGNAGSNLLRGLGGDDTLIGLDGNDHLDGGEGADWMEGGFGDDIYYVDNHLDTLIEWHAQGDDAVVTSISYHLAEGLRVETLRTQDPAGTAALALYGNEFGQSIYGNAGDNSLHGFSGVDYLVGEAGHDRLNGGEGADFMQGGTGDDIYHVEESGDVLIEFAGEGDDRVISSVNYSLAPGVSIETLGTTGGTQTAAINLTGNEFGQSLYGNDGPNVLNGGGGIDYMVGRDGNDSYVIDDSGDVLLEYAGEGDDILLTSVSYSLAQGSSIETMVASPGASAIHLTGNEFGQSLYGNDGNNELNGGGGSDYLIGGGGADLFVLMSAEEGPVDIVADFQSGVDRIGIDNAVFQGIDGGALAPGAFVTGTGAQDADDRIIYDPATGIVWFDADGNGPEEAVQVVQLQANIELNSGDFVII